MSQINGESGDNVGSTVESRREMAHQMLLVINKASSQALLTWSTLRTMISESILVGNDSTTQRGKGHVLNLLPYLRTNIVRYDGVCAKNTER